MKTVNVIAKPSTHIELNNELSFSTLNHLLSDVSPLYPNFNVWLNFTFRRNLASGERRILVAHDGDNLLGCALLKSAADESKICTFYVEPLARDRGIGRQLMQYSLENLDNPNTIITVSDDRQAELAPLLKSSGFSLQQQLSDHYRPQHSEFVYSLI